MINDQARPTDVASRVRMRHALRNLVLKDLELMEDVDECDYCHSTPEGHEPGCVFQNAVEVVYAEELHSEQFIKSALGDLLRADNMLLGTTMYICPYCDQSDSHDAECVYRNAIDEYTEK